MLDIRIWDVGAALSSRIITPAGQNHIIDAGASQTFSPAEHISQNYWKPEEKLDYLVISHFDADHCRDIPQILDLLGDPRVYLRNKTVPGVKRYGSGDREYQVRLRGLDERFTHSVNEAHQPRNPEFNGGVEIISRQLSWDESGESFNNTSIVMSYLYAGVMVVFPGDIEPEGWAKLVKKCGPFLDSHIAASHTRILVAPHHGRPSGCSPDMIRYLKPSAVVISDAYGSGQTDSRYYHAGTGIRIRGETKSLISTKLNGRKLIKISPDGTYFIDG